MHRLRWESRGSGLQRSPKRALSRDGDVGRWRFDDATRIGLGSKMRGRVCWVGPVALAMTTRRPPLYAQPRGRIDGPMLGRVSASLQVGNLAGVSQRDG